MLSLLRDSVIEYDLDRVVEATGRTLEMGIDPYEAIMDGLASGMERVGQLFQSNEYFLPEILLASDALYAGMAILRPWVDAGVLAAEEGLRGRVVIGSVEGDIHDIGKNLVKMMFEVAGCRVLDLGRDVPLEDFATAVQEEKADFLCLSAMMTTSMYGIGQVVDLVRGRNPQVRILVGGAPVNQTLAAHWGADGYAKSAPLALGEARRLRTNLVL